MKKQLGQRKCMVSLTGFLAVLTASFYLPTTAFASAQDTMACPYPVWSIAPFVGMLLSIALGPLVNAHWWENNIGKVSLFWTMLFALPAAGMLGANTALYELLHIMILDYVPFLILVAALFIIAGGINIDGDLPHTPLANTLMLLTGAVLASFVGTTGATMLLIRPIITANRERKQTVHTIVFLIFLVSNIGGVLTPVGDPPLFIGFLHGVPFFWTLHALVPWITNIVLLLALYFMMDIHFYRRHMKEKGEANPDFSAMICLRKPVDQCKEVVCGELKVSGLQNLLFLLGTLGAIIFSGLWATHPLLFDETTNAARGVGILSANGHELVVPYVNLLRDGVIIAMAWLSWKFTKQTVRAQNNFTWGPIIEVAILFAGIFATIVPALKLLQARGGELGVSSAMQFFWAAGALSSFLDNTPTYLAFLSLAGQMGAQSGVLTDLGMVSEKILLAVSCGSVFMGANTYIGNAPNFMARSIAEENGIKMPSFFGYMGWSICILIPLFLLDTFLFFL